MAVLSRQRSPTSPSRVRWPMEISFARHQFSPDIIRHAVCLYLRFTSAFRDVEDLFAERGLDVSYETVRRCGRCHANVSAHPVAGYDGG
jgi:transposase-like protein